MDRVVVASALLLLPVLTGCSEDDTRPPLPAGALAPGTIDIEMNGQPAVRSRDLSCTQITSFTTASSASGDSKLRAVVNNAAGLEVVSAEFTDVGGFTGSYASNLQGKADARLVGDSTIEISGVADGFFVGHPEDQSTANFTVRFAC